MLEISQLQTLVAVARQGSFSKAAQELLVTQSAISQSVKKIEKKLEIALFNRLGKKVILTTEGERLYLFATNFLKNLEDTLEEIGQDKDLMRGLIRLGTLAGVGKSWLAPRMLEFASSYKDLMISTSLGFSDDLIRDFLAYRLDILILPEDSLPTVGEKILVSEERSTLVFPNTKDFPLSKDITLEELASYPTVLFEKTDPLYFGWCKQRFGRIPKKINFKYAINSHGNMLQAVQQGLGVAIVPVHVLGRSYYKDKVATLGSEFELTSHKFYIVYHPGALDLKRIKYCVDFLRETTNPLGMMLTR